MNLKTLYGAALVFMACPAVAQNATFDVFEVHVGDSPTAVEKAMTEKGFSKYREYRGPTFEELISLRRKKIDLGAAKGALKEVTYQREQDRVSVMYTAWPDGEKVMRLTYHPAITDDDCPSFESAADSKYGSGGIKYAGTWIDRPIEKKGMAERTSDETVTVLVKCGPGSKFLDMSQLGAMDIQKRQLDKADGEVKHDF